MQSNQIKRNAPNIFKTNSAEMKYVAPMQVEKGTQQNLNISEKT